MSVLEFARRHPDTWRRSCYTIMVLLAPWLFADIVDGRAWITVTWWVVALAVIWLMPRRQRD